MYENDLNMFECALKGLSDGHHLVDYDKGVVKWLSFSWRVQTKPEVVLGIWSLEHLYPTEDRDVAWKRIQPRDIRTDDKWLVVQRSCSKVAFQHGRASDPAHPVQSPNMSHYASQWKDRYHGGICASQIFISRTGQLRIGLGVTMMALSDDYAFGRSDWPYDIKPSQIGPFGRRRWTTAIEKI